MQKLARRFCRLLEFASDNIAGHNEKEGQARFEEEEKTRIS